MTITPSTTALLSRYPAAKIMSSTGRVIGIVGFHTLRCVWRSPRGFW